MWIYYYSSRNAFGANRATSSNHFEVKVSVCAVCCVIVFIVWTLCVCGCVDAVCFRPNSSSFLLISTYSPTRKMFSALSFLLRLSTLPPVLAHLFFSPFHSLPSVPPPLPPQHPFNLPFTSTFTFSPLPFHPPSSSSK